MSYKFNFFHSGKFLFSSLFLLAIVLLWSCSNSFAAKRNIQFLVDAEAGQWKAARLKNLPKETTLQIIATGEKNFTALVVDEKSYSLLPRVDKPLFHKIIDKELTFSLTIPRTDNYYLVLDNRLGINKVSVHFEINASYDGPAYKKAEAQQKPDIAAFENRLNNIPKELEKLFIFSPFPIDTKSCGNANIMTSSEGITLCLEFLQKLATNLTSNEKVKEVLLFALFHEVGHVLLQQWDYPFYDNEEIADEFAAILLIMMNKQESLSSTAEYFLSNPTASELTTKTLKNDRHPLSIQRARNILQYIKDKDKIRRWIKFFVPHIQTPVLEKLITSPQNNVDKKSIKQELKRRKVSNRW